MLSNYNSNQRAYSNAPVGRSSLQSHAVSNFFNDDFFSDFHREFDNFSNRMMSRFDQNFSDFGSPFTMMRNFDDNVASMSNFSDCIIDFFK